MHLDKLQTIVTTPVAATHKIMWLKWWNNGLAIRDMYFFPQPLFPESQLVPWLNHASFYTGVIFQSSSTTYFPDIYVYIGVAKVRHKSSTQRSRLPGQWKKWSRFRWSIQEEQARLIS